MSRLGTTETPQELENFDNSFLSVSRGIVVDCKEMNTLVQQVAQLVTSKAPHTSPKQRFVDLAMRTPKSCTLRGAS